MPPNLKDALAADATLKAYNDAHPAPRIIDPSATTDLSNAKRFVQLHQRNIRYVPLWNCWMVWDNKRWVEKKKDGQLVPLVEEMIRELEREATTTTSEKLKDKLLKHANQTESENRIMACIRLAASQPEIQASPDDFDKDKYLINFQNGTVNLHTRQLREFRREDMITRICTVPYIPETPYPNWLAFMHLIFEGDESVIEYMQKFVGMAFTGDVSEELFHVLYGTAGTGKTTFMNTLNNILGGQYFKNAAVETILKRGQKSIANDIARLQGARIVWANEPEFNDILTEAKIKKLTSKERMLGEMKYREPAEFEPEYSLILSSNHKPIIRGTDEGLRRRVRLIPFNVKIVEGKDIHFLEKLKPEMEGIIEWVLEGCIKWQKDGLNPPEKILEATDEYHQEMDRLAEFFNLYIIKDPQARTPHILLYTVYKIWAEYSGVMVMSERAFTQMMIERGFKKITARFEDGRQFRGFATIKINDMQCLVTLAGDTIETNLITSVTDFLSAADTERFEKKQVLLHLVQQISNPFYKKEDIRTCENSVTSVTSVTNAMQSNDDVFSSSVTSVTSVTEIIKLLKEQYNQLNKPDSIQDLSREKINMRNNIILKLNEILPDNQDIPENEFIDNVVNDYCSVRGWQ